eukprot:XP_001705807.1 Hypothetical protein GL50803_113285 [Giardia lamblia ATCC 50803]
MGLPGRQQGGQRPGGAVGGRPGTARKGTYSNRLLSHTPASGQSGGVLTEEERALKEKGDSIMAQTRGTCPGCHTADPRPRHELPEDGVDQDHEARHDRHVPVPPRLREVQRRAGGQDPQPPQRPEPEARHLARRQVEGDRCGRHPAPPDGCLLQREGQEVQGRDAPDHLRDRRIPPPQSKGHLEELHVDLCPGCLRHRPHGCRGERAPDEADQTGRAESLATQSDRLLSSYF